MKMGDGFAAGFDAESEGEEGKFISGAKRKSTPPCPAPSRSASSRSMASPATAIIMGRNILRRMGHPQPQLSEADEALLKQRDMLLAARDKRVHPARDETLLADWNGMAISRAGPGGLALDRADWMQAAITTFDSVVKALGEGDRLYHSANGGVRGAQGFADDYAHDGARRPASVGSDRRSALPRTPPSAGSQPSTSISGTCEKGGYCTISDDAEPLIVRARVLYDQAVPSANGTMTWVLTRLGLITGEGAYGDRARALLDAFADEYGRAWASCASYITGLETFVTGFQIVVVGPRNNPRTQELIRAVWGKALPNRLLYVVDSGEALPTGHPAFGKGMENGAPTAYLCQRNTCFDADHQRGDAQPGADVAASRAGRLGLNFLDPLRSALARGPATTTSPANALRAYGGGGARPRRSRHFNLVRRACLIVAEGG